MTEATLGRLLARASYRPIFSLQEMTVTRIATILCNNKSLISLILKCEFPKDSCSRLRIRNEKEFKNVEAKGDELTSKIPAIGIYKEMILELLWPLTYRIILWKFLYAPTINSDFLCHFYWNNRGKIDNIRTAKYLIANEMIPTTNRYVLACCFCLKEEINDLWKRLRLSGVNERFLQRLLKKTLGIGSIETIKYCFSKLPEDMNSDQAVICFEGVSERLRTSGFFYEEEENDIGYFLFSKLTTKNQEKIFRTNFPVVLSYLLYSSDQNLFLKAWSSGLRFASIKDIEMVLLLIFYKYNLEIFRDLDYRMLFVNAWRLLPGSVKDYLTTESNLGILCFSVLVKNDFQFILQKGGYKSNPSLITALNLKPNTRRLEFNFKQGKWNLLHFLIEKEIVTTLTLEKKRDFVASIFPEISQLLALQRFISSVNDKSKMKEKQK